ncbi:MAG: DUF4912 domain-containing protein, partial [Cyanobacteria bacterium J06626_14]
ENLALNETGAADVDVASANSDWDASTSTVLPNQAGIEAIAPDPDLSTLASLSTPTPDISDRDTSDPSALGMDAAKLGAIGLGAVGLGLTASQLNSTTDDPDAPSTTSFIDDDFHAVPSVSQFIIEPSDEQGLTVHWEMPAEQRQTLIPQPNRPDASGLQLKIYDVTSIDLDHQPPHDVQLHDVPATAFEGDTAQMNVPVPLGDRDYLAELGYVAPSSEWMSLGRSLHTYVPTTSAPASDSDNSTLVMDGADPTPTELTPIITTDNDASDSPSFVSFDDSSEPAVSAMDTALSSAAAGLGVAGLGAMAIAHIGDEQASDSSSDIVPEHSDSSSTVTLSLADGDSDVDRQNLLVNWTVPDQQLETLRESHHLPLKMRLYDVTGIDLNAQPAHEMQVYELDETKTELTIPAPQHNRDYLTELGYETSEGQWYQLVRSLHVHVPERQHPLQSPTPSESPVDASTYHESESSTASFLSASAMALHPPLADRQPFKAATCHQWFTVNSDDHRYSFDDEQLSALQSTAQSATLDPGSYVITIEQGSFNYRAEHLEFSGEPIALLWLHGGRFINKQTNIETASTWVSLNGLDDVLNVDVLESTTLSALFFDTYRDDNAGKITLLILKDD